MFKNPFSFNGRIRRLEYGISVIIYTVIYYAFIFVTAFNQDSIEGPSAILSIIALLVFIPLFWFIIAQNAKRCHDRGNSGWWQLIPFYGLVLLFGDSEHGPNEYGPNPKDIGNESLLNDFAEELHPENNTE